MDIFKILKIVSIILIIFCFLFNLSCFKKLIFKVKMGDEEIDTKKGEREVIITYILMFIQFFMIGVVSSVIFIMQNGDVTEFSFNFNRLTNNYYKAVDRTELLNKAFKTVLEELDDPYTEMMNSKTEDFLKNYDSELGYSLLLKDDSVFVDNIKNNYIKELGLNEGDKILKVNDIDCTR